MKTVRSVVLPRSGSAGFTLLDVLVVISIIAILAGLLLPTLSRAKASARSVQCKSNLRQLALAVRMYVDDTGFYPNFFGPNGLSDTNWLERSAPYLGPLAALKGLIQCPGERNRDPVTSYGYNYKGIKPLYLAGDVPIYGLGLGGESDLRGQIFSTPESAVGAPSQMIALADGFYSTEWQFINPGSWIGVNLVGNTADNERWAKQRHGGKLNVSFCDGHVEAFRYRQLLLDQSSEILSLWNNDSKPHREIVGPQILSTE